MKRLMGLILVCALLACSASALAAGRLQEAFMIYEDYSGNRVEQSMTDEALLEELAELLLRTAKNPVEREDHPMNCTLFCMTAEDIYDFACATDGSPYITDRNTDITYQLDEEDRVRLWEIFDEVYFGMGFEASAVWDW